MNGRSVEGQINETKVIGKVKLSLLLVTFRSSQTVRRSAIAVNHPNTDPHHTTLGNRQHPPALDLDKLLADQEYKQRLVIIFF